MVYTSRGTYIAYVKCTNCGCTDIIEVANPAAVADETCPNCGRKTYVIAYKKKETA